MNCSALNETSISPPPYMVYGISQKGRKTVLTSAVNLPHTRAILEERALTKKMSPPDWSVCKPEGNFLD